MANIVVHNLPEEPSSLPYSEKARKDGHKVEELCRDVLRIMTKVEKAFRVGTSANGRKRVPVVRLQDESTKWELVRMARELRNSGQYSNIYISPDRTPEEQRRDKALRDELKRRRADGEAVEIRRGRIVPKMGGTDGARGNLPVRTIPNDVPEAPLMVQASEHENSGETADAASSGERVD